MTQHAHIADRADEFFVVSVQVAGRRALRLLHTYGDTDVEYVTAKLQEASLTPEQIAEVEDVILVEQERGCSPWGYPD